MNESREYNTEHKTEVRRALLGTLSLVIIITMLMSLAGLGCSVAQGTPLSVSQNQRGDTLTKTYSYCDVIIDSTFVGGQFVSESWTHECEGR